MIWMVDLDGPAWRIRPICHLQAQCMMVGQITRTCWALVVVACQMLWPEMVLPEIERRGLSTVVTMPINWGVPWTVMAPSPVPSVTAVQGGVTLAMFSLALSATTLFPEFKGLMCVVLIHVERCVLTMHTCLMVCTFSDEPDGITGIWVVQPRCECQWITCSWCDPSDSVLCAANLNLLPEFGNNLMPIDLTMDFILDIFQMFYVIKYTDYHTFETAL